MTVMRNARSGRATTDVSAEWALLRDGVEHTARRFVKLLSAVRDPGAGAVGTWSVGDTAAHVSVAARLDRAATTGRFPDGWNEVLAQAVEARSGDVATMNATALEVVAERDLRSLAASVSEEVGGFVDDTTGTDPAQPALWLGGTQLTVSAVMAHVLFELLVHGRDIAEAAGLPWEIREADALLAYERFILPFLGAGTEAFFGADASDEFCCELRIRDSRRVLLVFQSGKLSVQEPGTRAVDVRVSGDAAALLLLMFRRMSLLSAVVSGQLLVWGPRPWRFARARRVLRWP